MKVLIWTPSRHLIDAYRDVREGKVTQKEPKSALTQYWFEKGRPRGILFPNKFTGNYLTVSTLEQVMRRANVNHFFTLLGKMFFTP